MNRYFSKIDRCRALMVRLKSQDRIMVIDPSTGETASFPYNKMCNSTWESAIISLLSLPNPIRINSIASSRKGTYILITSDMKPRLRQHHTERANQSGKVGR